MCLDWAVICFQTQITLKSSKQILLVDTKRKKEEKREVKSRLVGGEYIEGQGR
jgi:hypothetical protein